MKHLPEQRRIRKAQTAVMIECADRLEREYSSALHEYLAHEGEADLVRAYDIGRRAITDGLSSIDIARVHQEALVNEKIHGLIADGNIGIAKLATNFLSETLAPFEMTHRGFQEALSLLSSRNGELLAVNRKLQLEVEERKKAEERIKEQATLLDSARDAIAACDLQERVTYWNKSAEALYGWTEPEALGKRLHEVTMVGSTGEYQQALQHVRSSGEWHGELRQVSKEGRSIFVESRWARVHDKDLAPRSILVVSTDVTERKRLENEVSRAKRMESIGLLASGIVHDINNILAPVLLGIQSLGRQLSDEQSQKIVAEVEGSIKRGADMIQHVLTFARGNDQETGAIQPAGLCHLVKGIVEETFPKSITIRAQIPANLWTVKGSAAKLSQVLLTVCINARETMTHGGTLVLLAENILLDENYAQMNAEAKPGPYVMFSVEDTGNGIPPEVVGKIFDPTFEPDVVLNRSFGNLSAPYEVVQQHGGFIHVYSEIGKGTQYKVYIPAVHTEQTQRAEKQKRQLPAGNGELILVVDDESAIREITKATLETYGYRVVVAADGAEAVAMYAQYEDNIKVTVTDIVMPLMNGETVIRAIRQLNPSARIIAASGLTTKEHVEDAAGTDNLTFLPKPYTAEALLTSVHEILADRAMKVT